MENISTYLLKEVDKRKFIKPIKLIEEPEKFRKILGETKWKILKLLAERPRHATEIAKILKESVQKVHYNLKELEKAGIVGVVEKREIRGATAKVYALRENAFAIDLGGKETPFAQPVFSKDNKVYEFFSPLISHGKFKGFIVVGSPDPHGPYQVRARDLHYAIELAFWLGNYTEFSREEITKLDVEIRAERLFGENLVLIGGVLTNVITAEINKFLPVRFSESHFPFRKIISEFTGNEYEEEKTGIIAKIPNPFCKEKYIIVLAGTRYGGTKASIIALTRFHEKVLKDYEGEEVWGRVVKGLDMDGDGKIDKIEIIE